MKIEDIEVKANDPRFSYRVSFSWSMWLRDKIAVLSGCTVERHTRRTDGRDVWICHTHRVATTPGTDTRVFNETTTQAWHESCHILLASLESDEWTRRFQGARQAVEMAGAELNQAREAMATAAAKLREATQEHNRRVRERTATIRAGVEVGIPPHVSGPEVGVQPDAARRALERGADLTTPTGDEHAGASKG
jgi:hypothetical protein